jgi:hypothetical protein
LLKGSKKEGSGRKGIKEGKEVKRSNDGDGGERVRMDRKTRRREGKEKEEGSKEGNY